MALAAPVRTSNKKDTRKRCGVCGKKFTPSHASQRYHPACSSSARKQVRVKRKPKSLPLTNQLIVTMIRAARYAGTVEIFEGNTVAHLHELRAMVKLRTQFSQTAGYDENGKNYTGHLSHVHPVMGNGGMGKFTPDNLVVCDANYNRSFSTTHLGHGSCIRRFKEHAKWQLEQHHTDAEVMELIIECIGRATWNEFAKVAKLLPAGRQMLVDSLERLLDPSNPEHARHLRAVKDSNTSSQALRHIHEVVTGKVTFEPYVKCCTLIDLVVHELERMSKYRGDLAEAHKALVTGIAMFEQVNGRHARFDFIGYEYQMFMDILHGEDVSAHFLQGFVERCGLKTEYDPVPNVVSPPRALTADEQERLERLEARIAERETDCTDELSFIERMWLECPAQFAAL